MTTSPPAPSAAAWRLMLPASMRAGAGAGDDYGVSDTPDWRTVSWGDHLRDIEVDGARVRFVDMGTGDEPPLLLVHGIAGCWQHWLENIAPLSRQRRVLAIDLPGFGSSDPLPQTPTITTLARHIDAFCERLGIGSVVAVGNSMGGYISAELALRHPERVDRLVLVDAAGLSIVRANQWHLPPLVRLLSALGTSAPLAERRALRRLRVRHLALCAIVRHPTRLAMDVVCEQIDGTGVPAFGACMTAMRRYDFAASLPQINCPTLVVFGENDALVPLRDAYEFVRLIPNSNLVVLPDTGHLPMLERPRTFNDAVRAFVSRPAPVAIAGKGAR